MYGLYRVKFTQESKHEPAIVYVMAAIAADAVTLVQADRVARGVIDKYRTIEHVCPIKDEETVEAMKPELRKGLPRLIPTELYECLTSKDLTEA